MRKTISLLLTILVAGTLTACGGGGGGSAPAVLVAAANAVLPASPTVASAVVNTPFEFPAGVPAFGTTAATTLVFTSTSTTPAFSITSGGKTASGTTAFGSCIFTITKSDFVPPDPLAETLGVGKIITVKNCIVDVATGGKAANDVPATGKAKILLEQAVSTDSSVTLNVNPGGVLSVNGASVGTVTLAPVTGGGG